MEARVRQLMFLCTNLEEQKQSLLKTLDEKETELMKARQEKEQLNTKYENLKMAQSLSSEGTDAKEAKLRFKKLVREIDKCIALLNE